jgi:hypothetical protein
MSHSLRWDSSKYARRWSLLIVFSLAACADQAPPRVASPAPRARSVPPVVSMPVIPRYNDVFRIVTHNSYWVNRDNVSELEASGTQERLMDQLLFDHAPAQRVPNEGSSPRCRADARSECLTPFV